MPKGFLISIGFLFCGCMALACSNTHSPQASGETHFLTACAKNNECGDELACICGVCSTPCDDVSACSASQATACARKDDPAFKQQCPGPQTIPGVCLANCEDQDCAKGQQCVSGACVATAATTATTYPNPTGTCTAKDDGSSWGYHGLEQGDVWMPDCGNQLTREYFRVFADSKDSAYMFPIGGHYLDSVCADPNHELHALAQRYMLCGNINYSFQGDAGITDALKLEHFLHGKLVFVPGVEPGLEITPEVLPSDMLELCQTDATLRTGPVQEECDAWLKAFNAGGSILFERIRTAAAVEMLVPKLNSLYGISGDDLCMRLQTRARESLDKVIADSDHGCTTDDDCVTVGRSSSCHDSCGAVSSRAAMDSVSAARDVISTTICTTYDNAACPAPIHPPCLARNAKCENNLCVAL